MIEEAYRKKYIWKDVQLLNNQENAIKTTKKQILSHSLKRQKLRTRTIPTVDKDEEQREFSCSSGGRAYWYNHFGKQALLWKARSAKAQQLPLRTISHTCAPGKLGENVHSSIIHENKYQKQSRCPPTVNQTVKGCGMVKQMNSISSEKWMNYFCIH